MEKQQTTTPSVRISMAEAMQVATIGEQTRKYLILIGKLHDLYEEAFYVVKDDIDDRNVEERMRPYTDNLINAIHFIEELTMWRMGESYGACEFLERREL